MARDPEQRREYQRQYRASEKGKAARQRELACPKQKAKRKEALVRYYATPEGRAAHVARQAAYEKTPNGKLARALRTRLYSALRTSAKPSSIAKALGCSLDEFKRYIEGLPTWDPTWTWAEHGVLFHIDHVKPLALWDLTDADQFNQAAHYTNLQALSIPAHKIKTAEDMRAIYAHRASLALAA